MKKYLLLLLLIVSILLPLTDAKEVYAKNQASKNSYEVLNQVKGTLCAYAKSSGKTGFIIGWSKIQGVSGYDIILEKSDNKGRTFSCKKIKSIKGNNTFKYTQTELFSQSVYKIYVTAYIYNDGCKLYVRNSQIIYAYTSSGDATYTNAKSISVNKSAVSVKNTKSFYIKGAVTKVNTKKKLNTNLACPVRFISTDENIASVDSSGNYIAKITAKKKGSCYIIAYTHNGLYKKVKVTVK